MEMTHFPEGAGGYADLAVTDADRVPPIAATPSFTHAAATPLAGGTAELVLGRLALPPGSRLLVLGGSGGVGLFPLQLSARGEVQKFAGRPPALHERARAPRASPVVAYTAPRVV